MNLTDRDLQKVSWTAVPARRLYEAEERLRRRALCGLAPPFVPFSPRERADASSVMRDARSVVVFSVPYGHPDPPDSQSSSSAPRAEVSRSSWGRDYHEVVKSAVWDLLPEIVGRNAARRAHVQADAGPLEEKAWAIRAGLGGVGENTCIYVPPYGSWVFLGLAVVDVNVARPDDSPHSHGSVCSGCRSCIEACPTGALYAPHRLNPKRCLSYLTQHKGFLPRVLRRAMGNRLFGCDTCQAVCPANDDVCRGLTAFAPEDMDVGIDPFSILQMSEEDFRSTWARKSSGWRGRRTLQRNALIVCANRGDTQEIDRLLPHLEDRRPVIRGHAAWAVGEILQRTGSHPGRSLEEGIHGMIQSEPDPRVRFEARRLLAGIS